MILSGSSLEPALDLIGDEDDKLGDTSYVIPGSTGNPEKQKNQTVWIPD